MITARAGPIRAWSLYRSDDKLMARVPHESRRKNCSTRTTLSHINIWARSSNQITNHALLYVRISVTMQLTLFYPELNINETVKIIVIIISTVQCAFNSQTLNKFPRLNRYMSDLKIPRGPKYASLQKLLRCHYSNRGLSRCSDVCHFDSTEQLLSIMTEYARCSKSWRWKRWTQLI
jgi:hypothetical protein